MVWQTIYSTCIQRELVRTHTLYNQLEKKYSISVSYRHPVKNREYKGEMLIEDYERALLLIVSKTFSSNQKSRIYQLALKLVTSLKCFFFYVFNDKIAKRSTISYS